MSDLVIEIEEFIGETVSNNPMTDEELLPLITKKFHISMENAVELLNNWNNV